MPRVLSNFVRLAFLSCGLVAGAGCVLHGDPLCPQNQAWRCQDDPRIGSCEFGCGWVNPWDDLCGEVVIVGETGCHGCHPCARDIACELDAQGVESRVIGKHEVNVAARDIFAGRNSGCWSGPAVIVGCRAGVDDAIRLCRILETVGIGVDKLILVGNTCCTFVPCNVAACVNLYYSDSCLAGCAGKPVCPEGDHTQTINLDLSICGDEAGLCSCSEYACQLAAQEVLGWPIASEQGASSQSFQAPSHDPVDAASAQTSQCATCSFETPPDSSVRQCQECSTEPMPACVEASSPRPAVIRPLLPRLPPVRPAAGSRRSP